MENHYLIIGGTTKAATTSLFYYLQNHPQIDAATMKETRFFLDEEYPVPSKYRLQRDGLDKYNDFFHEAVGADKVRMEATPDYLYGKNTPSWLAEHLPNAKVLFLLREPVSRFLSWYNFAKQHALIQSTTTLEEYFAMQREGFDVANFETALDHGNYSKFLERYINILGQSRVNIVFIDDLKENPQKVMQDVATFAHIDPAFYEQYEFKVHNPTSFTPKNTTIHRTYMYILTKTRFLVHNIGVIRGLLRIIRRKIMDPLYLKMNTEDIKSTVSEADKKTIDKIRQYYKADYEPLQKLVGALPWKA